MYLSAPSSSPEEALLHRIDNAASRRIASIEGVLAGLLGRDCRDQHRLEIATRSAATTAAAEASDASGCPFDGCDA